MNASRSSAFIFLIATLEGWEGIFARAGASKRQPAVRLPAGEKRVDFVFAWSYANETTRRYYFIIDRNGRIWRLKSKKDGEQE
jgi:hypothetical protein